jgi:hypothetical protein
MAYHNSFDGFEGVDTKRTQMMVMRQAKHEQHIRYQIVDCQWTGTISGNREIA